MSAVERVARAWHDGSDHARDGVPFGGYLCNCTRIAKSIMPLLATVWREGVVQGHSCTEGPDCLTNPYGADQ